MSIPIQCPTCQHKGTGPKCTAFPGWHSNEAGELVEAPEIPDAIYSGDFDHRLPYRGDNGIRFEPLPQSVAYWDNTPIFSGREQDEGDEPHLR